MKLAVLSCVAIVAISYGLSGCGDGGAEETGAAADRAVGTMVDTAVDTMVDPADDGMADTIVDRTAEPTTTTVAAAYVDVDVEPGLGTDGFVGALEDVELWECERDDDHWVASGFVTNSTTKGAAYRIYVAFNPAGEPIARGLVQVDLLIPAGETHPWEAKAWITDPALECVLRVERVTG
jgi:hypothetical protein